MAHQYMPKIFHDPHKITQPPSPPTYLMYGPLGNSHKYVNISKLQVYLQISNPIQYAAQCKVVILFIIWASGSLCAIFLCL